jgi:ribosome-binding protein aMBF1 (putative translation factor)
MSLLDNTVRRCERCDRETDHLVESIGTDSRMHYVCWECVERHEKRFNTKPGWRRKHRTRRYDAIQPAVVPVGTSVS